MELPPDLVADLALLEQKRVQFVLNERLGNERAVRRSATQLAIAAGCITTEYLPAPAPASQEITRG